MSKAPNIATSELQSNRTLHALLTRIAEEHLGRDLIERHSGDDYREASVIGLARALREAYEAGFKAATLPPSEIVAWARAEMRSGDAAARHRWQARIEGGQAYAPHVGAVFVIENGNTRRLVEGQRIRVRFVPDDQFATLID